MRKLSRRMFLGTAAAAPLASQVQDWNLKTNQSGYAPMPPQTPYYGECAQTNVPTVDPNYLIAKKEYLEKIARGEFTPEQEKKIGSYIDSGDISLQNLVSVSPAAKQIIYMSRRTKFAKKRYVEIALKQLKTLFLPRRVPKIEDSFKYQLPNDEDY